MTARNILGIVNTVLCEEILEIVIFIVTFVSGPQAAQIESGMCSTLQGTRRPLVFAVGNDTALNCAY